MTTGRQLIDAYHRLSANLTPGSLTVYRSALLWFLHTNASDTRFAPDFHDAYLELRSLKIVRPSSKRARPKERPIYLAEGDWRLLQTELSEAEGYADKQIGPKTLAWLRAAIAAGLRPNEWELATWKYDEQTTLLAPNSKQRPTLPSYLQIERANQTYRGLDAKSVHDLEGLPIPAATPQDSFREVPIEPTDREHVDRHLQLLREHMDAGGTFSGYYDMCRKRLERACKTVFKGKKRYSLYVGRHQFAANAKTKYPEHVVAQIMGHKAISTARGAYAASRYAHGGPGAQRPGLTQADLEDRAVSDQFDRGVR